VYPNQALVVTLPAGAPQQCAQPRDQLLARKGLDEVIVGTRLEAGDALADLRGSGEHQHGCVVAGRAHPPADLQAVEPWHEHVEDDRVGVHVAKRLHALATVGGGALQSAVGPRRTASGSRTCVSWTTTSRCMCESSRANVKES
jgi:hypothetical protein